MGTAKLSLQVGILQASRLMHSPWAPHELCIRLLRRQPTWSDTSAGLTLCLCAASDHAAGRFSWQDKHRSNVESAELSLQVGVLQPSRLMHSR